MLAGWMAENFVVQRRCNLSQGNACINNLRQLDGAAEQWRLKNNRATNAIPTLTEVNVYLKYPPACPTGGTYRYETNSGLPNCSVKAHVLP